MDLRKLSEILSPEEKAELLRRSSREEKLQLYRMLGDEAAAVAFGDEETGESEEAGEGEEPEYRASELGGERESYRDLFAPRMEDILKYIRDAQNGGVSLAQLSSQLGLYKEQKRQLSNFLRIVARDEIGVIENEGARKTSRWKLTQKGKRRLSGKTNGRRRQRA